MVGVRLSGSYRCFAGMNGFFKSRKGYGANEKLFYKEDECRTITRVYDLLFGGNGSGTGEE